MTTYVTEQPTENDRLSTHATIALRLSQAIVGNADLKYIGLLGRWGSGKSSIIQMLRKRLKEDAPEWRVFTFDAWAHHTDPLRRSFLERLAEFIEQEWPTLYKTKASAHWRKSIRQLSRNHEITKTLTRPQLTIHGAIVVVLAGLVPLGVRLVGDGVISEFVSPAALDARGWAFTLGWLLAIAPAAYVLVVSTVYRLMGKPQGLIGILASRFAERKYEFKSKSTEPTTIEFQHIYRKIVDSVQGAGGNLIVVVDNIDRLPPADAMIVWGEVRGMFIGVNENRLDWPKRPVVVLPADAAVLEQYKGRDERGELDAHEFIEKTFDIVFHVPPPVLAGWQRYFKEEIQKVIPGLTSREVSEILQVVSGKLRETQDAVTPRKIAKMVNDIGVAKSVAAADDIPLSTITFYTLHRREIDSNVVNYLNTKRPTIAAVDGAWQENLASLHYGLPKADAIHVLHSAAINNALYAGSPEELRTYSDYPGFYSSLLSVLGDREAGLEEAQPDTAALALAGLSDADNAETYRAELGAAWLILSRLMRAQAGEGTLRKEEVEARILIIDHLPEPDASAEVHFNASRLQRRLDGGSPSEVEAFGIWITALESRAKSRKLDVARFVVQDASLSEAFLASGLAEKCSSVLDLRAAPPELASVMVERSKGPLSAIGLSRSIQGAAALYGSEFPWSDLLNPLKDAALSGEPIRETAALDALLELWRLDRAALEPLREVAAHGKLDARLATIENVEEGRGYLALLLSGFILTEANPNLGRLSDEQLSKDASLTDEVVRVLMSDPSFGIKQIKDAMPRIPGLKKLAGRVADKMIESGRVDAVEIADKLPAYLKYFPVDNSRVLYDHLAMSAAFWDAVGPATIRFTEPLISSDRVPREVMAQGAGHASQAFARFPIEWHQDAIRRGGADFDFIVSVSTISPPTGSTSAAVRSLLDEAMRNPDQDFRRRWLRLIDLLPSAEARALKKTLLERLSSGAEVVDSAAFIFIRGADLLSGPHTVAVADGLTRHLLSGMFDTVEGKAWIGANAKVVSRVLAKSSANTKQSLIGRIRGGDLDEECREAMLKALQK